MSRFQKTPDLIVEQLWDQRDITVMMDCELPGSPSPEEFTRIGPLQGVRFILGNANDNRQ